jgi:uncharacterized membrane protein
MERDHTPLNAWLALVGVDAVLTAYYWPRLPLVLSQHFDGAGYPNGWAPKTEFVAFFWLMIGAMGALFFFLPKLLRLLPFALLNIPWKQYWSVENRQALALNILEAQMNWIGVVVAGLLTAVMWLVFDTNTSPIPRLNNSLMITLLVTFAAAMLGTLIALFRRFRPPS